MELLASLTHPGSRGQTAARRGAGAGAQSPGASPCRGRHRRGAPARSARRDRSPTARHLPMHRRAPQRPPHRTDRRRQELARLRARPPGLPRGLHRPLPALPTTPARDRHRPRRRSLPQAPRHARQARPPRHRRLRPRPPRPESTRDLLGILDDRCSVRSTLVTSQLPVEKWLAAIAEPTLADALLDRLVHNAYKLKLKGESMRKTKTPTPQADQRSATITRPRRFAPTGDRLRRNTQ
jgi:hypothetical protein